MFIYELLVPFDVLCAATFDCLKPRQRGHWEFEGSQEHPLAPLEFRLWQRELGELGTLRIKKTGDKRAEIYISRAAFPELRQWTDEEKKAIKLPKPERYEAINAVQQGIKDEAEKLYQKRRVIFDEAIEWYFLRLGDEGFWPSAPAMGDGDTGVTVQAGRNVSEKTKQAANIYKKIKDANPELSYAAVAIKATYEYPDELPKTPVADYDVRNAYKAMGWKWERADRIR